MVNQARFVRIALVFSGTLTVSMGLIALPAFSQVNSQVQLSETDMPDRIEPAIRSAPEATAEIATETVLEVTSSLDKADLEQAALAVVEPAIEPVIEPIAEMTGELTAADSETAMIEVAEALKSDIAEMQATAANPLSSEAEVTDTSAQALTLDEMNSATVTDALPAIGIENDSAAIASLLEAASLGSGSGVIEADSVPALKAALNSDNALTQLYAADALWRLTSDRDLILPTLISVAAGGNLQTRELATAAIGYLGRQALPAIPFLNRLLGEPNSRTQAIAQTALEVINSSNRPATTLGILTQGSRRQGVVPTVMRALTRLRRFR